MQCQTCTCYVFCKEVHCQYATEHSRPASVGRWDFGRYGLGWPQPFSGLFPQILSSYFRSDCHEFRQVLPKLRWTAVIERKSLVISRMIPGNWGKVESGWLTRPLLTRIARSDGGGRIHQFLWSRSHAVSHAKRNRAARSDKKPLRVGSSSPGGFRAWANRSYPEGKWLLLCISTGRVTLADSINRLKPPNERAH
jgi:hypothetical protein